MTRLTFTVALGAIVWACAPLGAFAQTSPVPTPISLSDDLNADGVKLRGDGSIDDHSKAGDDHVGGREDEADDDHGGGHENEADDHHGGDNGRGGDREHSEREDHSGHGGDRERGRDRESEHGGHGHG